MNRNLYLKYAFSDVAEKKMQKKTSWHYNLSCGPFRDCSTSSQSFQVPLFITCVLILKKQTDDSFFQLSM
jgi:hypothetical protein